MILPRLTSNTKAIPGSDTICSELSLFAVFFETYKRRRDSVIKLVRGNVPQLRFRIVNVVDVDCLDLHIAERLVELVLKIARCHTVATADEIIKRCNTGFDECLLKIIPDVASRHSIERDVTALGADNQLTTRVAKLIDEIVQGFSDSSFASLKPVVCSGVDHVCTELNGPRDRVL